jgi:hypothetical protein
MHLRGITALLLATALLTTGCTAGARAGSKPPPTREFDLGANARLLAPAAAFGPEVRVTGAIPTAPLPDITGLPSAAAVEVTVTAQPKVPVVVRIPVPAAAFASLPPDQDARVLVLHQHAGQQEALFGRLDRVGSAVSVTTGQLSIFDVRLPSLDALGKQVAVMLNGAIGGVFVRPPAPSCDNEAAARAAGWTATSTQFPVLQWCLGLVSGKPQLRVVASRRYPLLASLGDSLTVRETTGGEIPVALAQAVTQALAGRRQVTLAPGGTTVLDVSLAEGQQTQLRAEFDGLAQSLVSLQIAADLIIEIAKHMPFSTVAMTGEQLLASLDAGGCVPKLLDLAADVQDVARVGAMVSACLDLKQLFTGSAGVLSSALAGIVAVIGQVLAYMWNSASALVDEVKNQDHYTITIGKQSATAPCTAAELTRVLAAAHPGMTFPVTHLACQGGWAVAAGVAPNVGQFVGALHQEGTAWVSTTVDDGSCFAGTPTSPPPCGIQSHSPATVPPHTLLLTLVQQAGLVLDTYGDVRLPT